VIDESWYIRPPGVSERTSAGGVVVRAEGGRVFVALTRERDFSDYILPKGQVAEGETPEQAARREIEEEAGLTGLALLEELGVRERLNFRKRFWTRTCYFLFATDQLAGKPTDGHHEYVLEWFPIDELPSLFWPEQRELIETNRDRIIERAVGAKRICPDGA